MASGSVVRSSKRRAAGDTLFQAANYLLMAVVCVVTVYPFLNVLGLSLSTQDVAVTQAFRILPRTVTLDAYKKVVTNDMIWIGYRNTVVRIVLGTGLSLLTMMLLAYALSKRTLPFRKLWTLMIVFTMFFHGGIIPTYLMIRAIGLMDRTWSLVLPPLVNTFSMIVIRNYFMTLPSSLEESAKMDGGGDFLILFRIIAPVSLPILATVTLWTMVWHWNAWFDCLLYIQTTAKSVLQVVLRRIVLEGTIDVLDVHPVAGITINPEVVKAATVVFATLPILLVYPFIQKYFVRGIMVGSLKG